MFLLLWNLWLDVCLLATGLLLINLYFKFKPKRKANVVKASSAVVITGCDTGFGSMAAVALSKVGFKVIATCMTDAGIAELSQKVYLAVKCDVTIPEQVDKLNSSVAKALTADNLKLWALINNAGIGIFGLIDYMSMNSIRKMMDVNYIGLVAVTKALLPFLKCNPGSRIINISSVAGLGGAVLFGPYSGN
jgi:dehydrogenase/reductase SDR family protein 9